MLNVGTITEFNVVILWFNLVTTWVIQGRDRLILKVVEWAEELWMLLALNLQVVDSFLKLSLEWAEELRMLFTPNLQGGWLLSEAQQFLILLAW